VRDQVSHPYKTVSLPTTCWKALPRWASQVYPHFFYNAYRPFW
jgi:hypothetical protein